MKTTKKVTAKQFTILIDSIYNIGESVIDYVNEDYLHVAELYKQLREKCDSIDETIIYADNLKLINHHSSFYEEWYQDYKYKNIK